MAMPSGSVYIIYEAFISGKEELLRNECVTDVSAMEEECRIDGLFQTDIRALLKAENGKYFTNRELLIKIHNQMAGKDLGDHDFLEGLRRGILRRGFLPCMSCWDHNTQESAICAYRIDGIAVVPADLAVLKAPFRKFIRITLLSTRYRILLPLYAGARHRGIRPADSSRQGVFLICICSVPEEFFPDGKGSSGWAIAFPKGSVVPQVTARRVYTSFPGAPEAPCIPLRSLGLLPVPCPGRSGRFWP
ncbi:MAG: hypothetical protein ACFWT7_03480 [Succiniclasticum sp.]|jgi:hypothetical protein